MLSREAAEPNGDLGVETELGPPARVLLFLRAWPVGGQVQHGRRVVQRAAPVVLLSGERTVEDGLLPGLRVVGELDRERRQWVRGARRERLVELAEFVHHDVHRDAVVDAVMERQQQYVAVRPQGEHASASEGAGVEVERPLFLVELAGGDACVEVRGGGCAVWNYGGGACGIRDLGVGDLGVGSCGEVLEGQGESPARWVDVLVDLPLGGHQPCPQRLMTVGQLVEGPGQQVDVERAGQGEGDRLVVRGVRARQLGQEPQSPLGEGGRSDAGRQLGAAGGRFGGRAWSGDRVGGGVHRRYLAFPSVWGGVSSGATGRPGSPDCRRS